MLARHVQTPVCTHAAQGSCVRAEQAGRPALQPGRVAWRLRAWLGIVPRAGSALRQAAAAPPAQVGQLPSGMRHDRGRVARAQRRHCKLKISCAPDPHSSGRLRPCAGRIPAQCSIVEQHAQGGVLSTAGRRRTRVHANCAHAQLAPLHFLTCFLCGRSGWRAACWHPARPLCSITATCVMRSALGGLAQAL